MIFVIDVGNTNMTMGVFQGKKLEATFRIMTTEKPFLTDFISSTEMHRPVLLLSRPGVVCCTNMAHCISAIA